MHPQAIFRQQSLGFHGLPFGLNPSIPFVDGDGNPLNTDEVNTRTAVMGRINYSYSDRYNFSASIRRDGFSRFGADNVYGNFPSLSAAWTVTNEDFMASGHKWLNYLKIRASWGVNGNSSGLEQYNAYAKLSSNLYLNYDGGYVAVPYGELTRIANPNLSWERNEAYNLGIDFGLFDSRLSGSLDVYTSLTKDLLLDQKLPEVTGFGSAKTNVGDLRNHGVEIGLNSTNISTSDFSWTSSFNISYATNKIVTLGNAPTPVSDAEGNPILDSNGNPVLKEADDLQNGWFIGENKDVIWDYQIDGVYQLGEEAEAAKYGLYPGDFKYVDQDNNGVINVNDKVFQGLSKNPWYITLRNDLEFKGFDFGVVFLAKLGYKGGSQNPFNNQQEYIKNHNWYDIPYWTPNNPINDAARINSINLGGSNIQMSKSYVRLQNVSLGYSLPTDLLEKVKLDRVRLAFNIENAAIWTKWPYGDPESDLEMPRTYSFSLDFTF